MIVTTTDPVTGKEVFNPETHPFLIEGEGDYALKIYFESEANREEYLNVEMHEGVNSSGLKKIFDEMAENPDTGSIN